MVKQREGGLGPAFANIFTANLASSLGDGIARTAFPLLAARITHDPLLISGIAALALLPWLFFAIPAGILIDRIDRRKALALAQAVRTILGVLLFVLVLTNSLTIWWIYIVVFVYGAFETVYDGAIRAVVPSIVDKANLPRGNSRIEGGELVVQNFVAGPVTSFLFGVSVLIPLGVNGLVFAFAGALALLLPRVASGKQFTEKADGEPHVAWYRQFVDGFRFIMANRMLRTLWFFSTFGGIMSSAATASFVLFILDDLHVPEPLFGVFLVTGAVGGIIGAVLANRLKKLWGAGLSMAVMNLVASLAFVFIGLVPVLWAGALGFALTSLSITVWNILVMSLRQSVIPGRLLGRVHGTWRTLLWGSMPLGSLLGGLLGRVNLELPFIIGGGLEALACLVFFRFLMRLPNPEDIDNGDEVAEAGPTDPLVVD
ncbi:MAG: MFS transporter [Rhodoglobus sp.]